MNAVNAANASPVDRNGRVWSPSYHLRRGRPHGRHLRNPFRDRRTGYGTVVASPRAGAPDARPPNAVLAARGAIDCEGSDAPTADGIDSGGAGTTADGDGGAAARPDASLSGVELARRVPFE